MAKKTDKPQISKDQSLESAVTRNPDVVPREKSDGSLMLQVPFKRKAWLKRRAKKDNEQVFWREFELDEIGTFVWGMCDGETTVRQMRGRLADKYKLGRREAEISLTNFLSTLGKKGLVAILVPKKDEDAEVKETKQEREKKQD